MFSRAGASTTRVLVLPKLINMNIVRTLYSSTTWVPIFQYSYSYVQYSPQPWCLVLLKVIDLTMELNTVDYKQAVLIIILPVPVGLNFESYHIFAELYHI